MVPPGGNFASKSARLAITINMQSINDLSKRQLEALRIVRSDLNFIKSEWNDRVDDDSLRRYSPTLRQLLVDEGGLLLKVEEWLNYQIYLQAPPNPLLSIEKEKINFYTAGGAKYQNMTIQSLYEVNYAMSAEEIKKQYENSKNNIRVKYSLIEFLNAPCVIYKGEVFSRVELIKFVSNKLGGTHYELDEKKMARMRLLLDVKNAYMIAGKSAIYFEILSLGQLLVESKYTARLIKKIDSLI